MPAPAPSSSSPTALSPTIRRYFGTDGVRGVANTDLSPSLALALGAASARILKSQAGGETEVVVGRDPRRSGDLLSAALIAGLCSQGAHVVEVGVVPTPGVAYITRYRGASAGAVISASHNPMRDNGIKFFGPDGRKLADAIEADIEAAMETWEAAPRPTGADVGRVTRTSRPIEDYAAHLFELCGPRKLTGMRLVVDGANGAAHALAPDLLRRLGAEVIEVATDPDGININEQCGSTHPDAMAARVRAERATAGLAFDGDADRVILADERGRLFDGDRTLCAAGLWLHTQNRLPNAVVVGTIMSNLGLDEAFNRAGIRLVRANVGDRYVAESMHREGAVLGGEKSGHILFTDHTTTGDGLLTALQILCLCRDSGRSLASWSDEMREFPQRLESISVLERDGWEQVPAIASALADAQARLQGRGRINVRPSGTEKKIRVMVEGPDADEVNLLVEQVAGAIRRDRGA